MPTYRMRDVYGPEVIGFDSQPGLEVDTSTEGVGLSGQGDIEVASKSPAMVIVGLVLILALIRLAWEFAGKE